MLIAFPLIAGITGSSYTYRNMEINYWCEVKGWKKWVMILISQAFILSFWIPLVYERKFISPNNKYINDQYVYIYHIIAYILIYYVLFGILPLFFYKCNLIKEEDIELTSLDTKKFILSEKSLKDS